jgi:predicted DNA-binding transcriptional regulator YafY
VHRHDDGAIDVEVPCANIDAFRSWLFGLGEHAEVVSPLEVRAVVVAWLREMAGAR